MEQLFFYIELQQATEMSPSWPTAGSPLFQMAGPLEGCVSCFSGSQMPSFSIRNCRGLLRYFHPSLLQAVPVIVCCPQQGRLKEAEEKGNPVGRPAVSIWTPEISQTLDHQIGTSCYEAPNTHTAEDFPVSVHSEMMHLTL